MSAGALPFSSSLELLLLAVGGDGAAADVEDEGASSSIRPPTAKAATTAPTVTAPARKETKERIAHA